MPPMDDAPLWLGMGLLGVGAALLGYAARAWQDDREVRIRRWFWMAGTGVAVALIGIWLLHRWQLGVSPPVPLSHKPVNVANLNNIESSDPTLFTERKGTGRVYFAANGTLLRDGSHGTAQKRIYGVDGAKVMPIDDVGRDEWPVALAVVPGADPAKDKVLFAEGSALWSHDGSNYVPVPPKSGTPAAGTIHALCADGSLCLMLASTGGVIALYEVHYAKPEYEKIDSVVAEQASALEMSAENWRRATFFVKNGGTTTMYRWADGGSLAQVVVPKPKLCHSGPKVLLVAHTDTTSAPMAVRRVKSDGTTISLTRGGLDGHFQAVCGMQSWNGETWVLALLDGHTRLYQLTGDDLVEKQDLGDLGPGLAGDPQAPRGLVPLPNALGFVSGANDFWNVTGSPPAEKVTAEKIEMVKTLWPAGGIGYCSARDIALPPGASMGFEPWTWTSH